VTVKLSINSKKLYNIHNRCSKCPLFAATQARRHLRHCFAVLYIGWSDVTSVAAVRSPFCRSTRCTVWLNGEDLSCYLNKIESVGLRKCPYYRYLIEKVTSSDVRATNISQSLPHKMAENSWYEEITSLSPYLSMTHWSRRYHSSVMCCCTSCTVRIFL